MRKSKYNADVDLLKSITVESTETYTAITHKEIIELVEEVAKDNNVKLYDTKFYSANNGKIAEGQYTLDFADADFQLKFVWQNSTDKTVSFKCAIGSEVFLCTNGCVWGDLGSMKRIHTGDADTEVKNKITELFKNAEQTFEEYKALAVILKSINDMTYQKQFMVIGDLFFQGLINSDQINCLKREYDKPTFDYGYPETLWELWQNITHSFKLVSPRHFLSNQIKISQYFAKNFEINV